MQVKQADPTTHCNNQNVENLMMNVVLGRQITWKQIVTTFDNIQQLVENEEVELLNYATQMHTMDILSRPLSLDKFLEFSDKTLHSKIAI